MLIITASLSSCAPYEQSRQHFSPKLEKESADDYEQRTWREKAHVDETGIAFIPPMAFKNCVASAAKYLSLQIPGKGKSTYTKHFLAGVLVTEGLSLGVHKNNFESMQYSLNADGIRGSGKRVNRRFPIFRQWSGKVDFFILDPIITKDVFHRVLVEAGKLTGVGRFRPECGGFFGRFTVDSIKTREE